MEKVLLAIDGVSPDRRVFSYAVQLCKRIQAGLNVLQIINPRNYDKYLKIIREKTEYAKKYLEGSLVAATFAEAGEHDTANALMSEALQNIHRLLPESEQAGIKYELTMKSGDPQIEIVNYVNAHRDVVLTIYDTPQKGRGEASGGNTAPAREIRRMLDVPVVVLRGMR